MEQLRLFPKLLRKVPHSIILQISICRKFTCSNVLDRQISKLNIAIEIFLKSDDIICSTLTWTWLRVARLGLARIYGITWISIRIRNRTVTNSVPGLDSSTTGMHSVKGLHSPHPPSTEFIVKWYFIANKSHYLSIVYAIGFVFHARVINMKYRVRIDKWFPLNFKHLYNTTITYL